jgi:hypothetical protein
MARDRHDRGESNPRATMALAHEPLHTQAEQAYLTGEPRLAGLAIIGADETPHIAPVGCSCNPELGSIDVGGARFRSDQEGSGSGPHRSGRHRG